MNDFIKDAIGVISVVVIFYVGVWLVYGWM